MAPYFTYVKSLLPRRNELGPWALTFIAFLVTAKLGQFLYSGIGTAPAFIWPPAGIALASLFLYGSRMWSAIALAAIVATVSNGSPLTTVIASSVGNTLQALVGAYLFRLLDFRPNISRLRDTLLLMIVALVVTTIVPTVALAIHALTDALTPDPFELWRIVWSGGILSVLILTPLITGYAQDFRIKRDRLIEHSLAFLFLWSITYLIFWYSVPQVVGISLIYVLLVPLFWIALRFEPRSTALALFSMTAIALAGVVLTTPENVELGARLFQTQLFVQVFAIIYFIFASVIEERRTVTRDLGEHVHQLERAITKIREQDSAKSDFLATLAHELRNPLAPVLSTLELLRLRRNEGEEAALLAGAEQRLHMMSRLLDDLLDISRVSEKRLTLKKEFVNLREIAQRSVEGARPLMEKYNHALTVNMPKEEITLYADPIRIEQILINVLNNAAKYTHPSGLIEFDAHTHDRTVVIKIRDNGTGIEAGMLSRIFEPFLQISASKYGTSGVGIGLALAKELVEMHGGTIRAESAGLGTGSTFVIELPIADAPVKIFSPVAVPVPTQNQNGTIKILVIDDNQAGTEALGRLLTFRGHTLLLAYSGSSGLDLARAERPDVILLDIGLPDIDGYEVARRLRTDGSTSFIVALTGYGQEEDRRKSIEAGCDAHLIKPVSLKDLENLIAMRVGARDHVA